MKKLIIFGISLVLVATLIFILASSVGPFAPGTCVNDDSIGSLAWTYPDSAKVRDEYVAHVTVFTAGGASHAEDYSVRLVSNGVIVGDNLANTNSIPTSMTDVVYGGSTNLWGETWSVENINANNFGVVYSVVGKTIGDVTVSLYSYYLNAANFGFSIPTGSAIDGIKVTVHCQQYLSNGMVAVDVIEMTIYYTVPDLPEGSPWTMSDSYFDGVEWSSVDNAKISDNAYSSALVQIDGVDNSVRENSIKLVKAGSVVGNDKSTGAILQVPESYRTYGGATDLWGETWTPAQINANNFGFVFSVVGDVSGTNSNYLKATDFRFDIPTGATILGIKVEVEATWNTVMGHDGVGKVDHIRMTIYYTSCGCPGLNQNWEIDMPDHCVISSACNLGTGTLSFAGSGYATCDARIDTTDMGDPGANGILYINDECVIIVD